MPSIYIPCKSPATLARMKRLDDGLAALCDSQPTRPLTQEEIAERCGCTKQMIGKIETSGRRKMILGLKELGITSTGTFRGRDTRAVMRLG